MGRLRGARPSPPATLSTPTWTPARNASRSSVVMASDIRWSNPPGTDDIPRAASRSVPVVPGGRPGDVADHLDALVDVRDRREDTDRERVARQVDDAAVVAHGAVHAHLVRDRDPAQVPVDAVVED